MFHKSLRGDALDTLDGPVMQNFHQDPGAPWIAALDKQWNQTLLTERVVPSRSRSSTGRRRSRFCCQGKVEVISVYDREIRAVSFSFKLPSVIRLLRYIKIKRRFDYVPFSRANIYARDNHECQYCGDGFPTSELTFDHVVAGRSGRPQGLGEHRHVLRHVQSQERWAHAG